MIQIILKSTAFKRGISAALAVVIIIVSASLAIKAVNKNNNKNKHIENTAADQVTSTTKPAIDKNQWNLILVNKWNYLPENYAPEIKYLDNGQAIDKRAYADLQDMMNACRGEGLEPLICSSYRTMEKQEMLFNNKINEYLGYGYSQQEAEQKADELVAIPGTSEHQLALALDIVDISYQILDEKQENTPVQKWLIQNSWKYGFILRYPTDKSNVTGISYEPWHYRYVGKEAAKEIFDAQICLEEYLNS
ncbi:MAG: M15 family metallopeptidase [Clostridium sp.]|nr:M15 family metallopeptidase [Clostridium sp.]